LAGWVKPRLERIYHPRENNNFRADSLHAKLEYYIANNAKFFAEHKVSRFDNIANEPQGEPFDDNFTKISLEVTF
jgi:regulation of enolase protein 1 (concanavalin A-like superfamily)